MKILVLGGSSFVGWHAVDALLAHGHSVTLFNRGNAEAWPDVPRILGDRDPLKGAGLGALAASVARGERWDAVLDCSGYFPRHVAASAVLLQKAAAQYVFISSISVYDDPPAHADENAKRAVLQDEQSEVLDGGSYGALKALCEREVQRVFGASACVVRPGLVVGPRDPTDRFSYWPWRVAQGGDVLAPGSPTAHTQFVDARDLAGFVLRLLEGAVAGVFHAVAETRGFGAVLEACNPEASSLEERARFVWVAEEFLNRHAVAPWTGANSLPLWIPGGSNLMVLSNRNAVAAGLTTRPLEETVRETLAWVQQRNPGHVWASGLSLPREAELLQAWRTENQA